MKAGGLTARAGWPTALAALTALLGFAFAARAELPSFDFTTARGRVNWVAAHDCRLTNTSEGLIASISGNDPFIIGPARDYPPGTNLWLRLRLKSDSGGIGQVFYFPATGGPAEENSVKFSVPGGRWFEARVALPALGTNYQLRVDPPGDHGTCVLGRLEFEERFGVKLPQWPVPVAPDVGAGDFWIQSGDLKLGQNRSAWGGFEVRVGDERMAAGNTKAFAGYTVGSETRWLAINSDTNHIKVKKLRSALLVETECADPDGGRWKFQQKFSPGHATGTIKVETSVLVDRDRCVVYLPMFTLLAGMNSFGTNKTQAVFPGLEYLDNDPSSSEADLRGKAARRQVPNIEKITAPLMAVAARGNYVGLIWELSTNFCAAFDSPDRLFNSGGHLMSILFPTSDGLNREENSLVAGSGQVIRADHPVTLRATVIGGLGPGVVPAMRQYVNLYGLPPVPRLSASDYFKLAASGWLDSKIREGNLYRHAAWPGFGPQPAADAALWMDWLSGIVRDPALADRLQSAATGALSEVKDVSAYNFGSGVGHVRYPAPALVFGHVQESAEAARRLCESLAANVFLPDGTVRYHPRPGGVNYAATWNAPDVNGMTAAPVAQYLEALSYFGDTTNHEFLRRGIFYLNALGKFRDTVPRGAQSWEIPLHAPDILAAAHLVRAYTLGYELTGDPGYLAEAKYWAWTGAPFVYLVPPTPQPVGPYSTIAVFSASSWTAPVWIGLPVQWCGLVYADAIRRFARHDPSGPWKRLADGISASGIQQTFPASDGNHRGLLPDSFVPEQQVRNPPPINPATVLSGAQWLADGPPVYDSRAFPRRGLFVHAPGLITPRADEPGRVKFQVAGWPSGPYWIVITGVWQTPRVKINGHETALAAPHDYVPANGRLVLQLKGKADVEIF